MQFVALKTYYKLCIEKSKMLQWKKLLKKAGAISPTAPPMYPLMYVEGLHIMRKGPKKLEKRWNMYRVLTEFNKMKIRVLIERPSYLYRITIVKLGKNHKKYSPMLLIIYQHSPFSNSKLLNVLLLFYQFQLFESCIRLIFYFIFKFCKIFVLFTKQLSLNRADGEWIKM